MQFGMVWYGFLGLACYTQKASWWQLKLSRTGQSTLPAHKLGIKSVSPGLGRHVPLTVDHTRRVPREGSQQSPRKVDGVQIQYRGIERLISDHPSREGAPSVLSLYQHCWWPLHNHTGRQTPDNQSNVLWSSRGHHGSPDCCSSGSGRWLFLNLSFRHTHTHSYTHTHTHSHTHTHTCTHRVTK